MSDILSALGQSLYTKSSTSTSKLASNTSLSGTATKSNSDPISEFLAYQKLTPQEKIVDAILKKNGLTKEDLAKLPPDKQKKIMDEIKAEIQSQTKKQLAEKGILVDMSA
jgi:hypothetical protein